MNDGTPSLRWGGDGGAKLHSRVPTGAHHPGINQHFWLLPHYFFLASFLQPSFNCEIQSIVVYFSPFPQLSTQILELPFSPAPVLLLIIPNPKLKVARERRALRAWFITLSRLSGFCIYIIHKNFMQIIRNLIKYVLDKIFPQSCFGKKIAAMTDKEQKKPSSPSNLVRVGSGLVNKLALLNPVTGESDEPILVGFEDVSAAAYRIRKGIKKTPCEVNICRKLTIILQHHG